MAKFTFPIPGRRQKPAAVQPVWAPLSKAQKILGTSGINIDLTSSPNERAGSLEPRPVSAISISISESTSTGFDEKDEGGLGILTEGEVVNNRSPRVGGFEESNIIPSRRNNGGLDGFANDVPSLTDASSLRRRESSSTIMSYYDKSKVPLGISQQTSNSAMAKGLPPKASSLLDINGTMSMTKAKKKKPAMLDLSYLLPKPRSPPRSKSVAKSFLLGLDLMTKSPSTVSQSSLGEERPPTSQRGEKKLRKKLTGETLRDQRSELLSPPEPVRGQSRSGRDSSGLSNLYEHYERMSLRDAIANSTMSEQDDL